MFKNSIIIILLLVIALAVSVPTQAESPAPDTQALDAQGRSGSNASIFVYNVALPAFRVEWSNSNVSNSWSYLDPNGCNLDPTCAANGALLWNSFAKQSQIIVYTDTNPNLTCWVCAVRIEHYKYPVDDAYYRSSVDMGGYWVTTFSNYP